MEIHVEGISGETYELGVKNTEIIQSIEGADLDAGKLKFYIPEGKAVEFVPYKITINLKNTVTQ